MQSSEIDPSVEKRLIVLRELIELQDIYTITSARSALVAGALSTLVAAAIFANDELVRITDRPVRSQAFVFVWTVVLVLAATVSAFFLRDTLAKAGKEISWARIKFVLATTAPCLLVPIAFTSWFLSTGYLGGAEVELVIAWIAFYGLTLLSTSAFAPSYIAPLGWVFLLTALSVPLLEDRLEVRIEDFPVLLMGGTFGLYHLVYAAVVWPRLRRPELEQN